MVLLDIDEERGRQVATTITDSGGTASYLRADVARGEDWQAATLFARQRYGGVDIVHSNAYLHVPGAPETLTLVEWQRVLDVTLTALFHAAAATVAELRARNGTIVATSSVHQTMSLRDYSAYAAAKGGLDALVRQLAVQYAPQVRVNAVVPGPIDTGVWDPADTAGREAAGRATLTGRMGTPEEVAAAVCFLAAEESAFITGATLRVDGGWSIKKDST